MVCYDGQSGQELWVHGARSRFWEVIGGAGPRATPTLSEGKLFALGPNGLLHRLDPLTGEQIWQRELNVDAGREPPEWGYASSPLVHDDVVIVHAGGADEKGVLAYDVDSGDLRWSSPAGDHSYSSPHYAEICGSPCILMLTNQGLNLIDPTDGRQLGKHDWKFEGYRVVQPLVIDDTSVVLGTAMGTGSQRVEFQADGEHLTSEEMWLTRGISPYYNNYVVHQGHIYGFDNNIFACVDWPPASGNGKEDDTAMDRSCCCPRTTNCW